jgi:hypothetical protein
MRSVLTLMVLLSCADLTCADVAYADEVDAPDAVLVLETPAAVELLPPDAGAVVVASVEVQPVVEVEPVVEPEPVPAEVTVEVQPEPTIPAAVNEYWLTILVTLVGGMLTWALGMFSKWLSSRTKNEGTVAIIAQATDAAQTAVAAVQGTTVAGLKAANADGKLTAEEAKAVLADALAAAKAVLGTKGLDTLKSAINLGEKTADEWLTKKIEAEVTAAKPPTTPTATLSTFPVQP